jgi:uncharacterized membrane protein
MTSLILGLVLWTAGHFFKRVMPGVRASMGNPGKGVVAVILILSVYLMVSGYRSAEYVDVWTPPFWAIHVTDLFMVFAVGLFVLAHSKSRLRGKIRHPMLAGVRVWAGAHLLVNGDLASVVLFGGLFVWALAEVIVLNRAEPDWKPYSQGTKAGDIRLAVITIVVFAAIAGVHYWLGYPVFPG